MFHFVFPRPQFQLTPEETMATTVFDRIPVTRITSDLLTAAQMSESDFRKITSLGVRSVVNLRVPSEAGFRDDAKLCQELGMRYEHVPITSSDFKGDFGDALMAQLDGLSKPILIYCKSGTRANAVSILHAATRAQLQETQVQDLIKDVKAVFPDFMKTFIMGYVHSKLEWIGKLSSPQLSISQVARAPQIPIVHCLPHKDTSTCTYVVYEEKTKDCVLIDTVADFSISTGSLKYTHADSVIAFVKEQCLNVTHILETHVHADHLTAAQYCKERLGGQVCIGDKISQVQNVFDKIYNVRTQNEQHFDILLQDNMEIPLGPLKIRVWHTPGHTPACVSYLVGDAVFTGDTLFHPDIGTARCDFPGGSLQDMWTSCQKLLALPPTTRNFLGHDYPPSGRAFTWEVPLALQQTTNRMVKRGTTEAEFMAVRATRDAGLATPALLIPSIQVNIRGGKPPQPDSNGVVYLRTPINVIAK